MCVCVFVSVHSALSKLIVLPSISACEVYVRVECVKTILPLFVSCSTSGDVLLNNKFFFFISGFKVSMCRSFTHSNMWRINRRWREMLQIIPFHRIGNDSTVTNRRKHYFVTSKCVIMNGDDHVCLCVRITQLWFANTKRKRRENKNSFQLNVESLCVLVYVGVGESNMIIRWMKISLALVLSLILTISLTKLVISVWENFNFGTGERYNVEVWLEQNQLHQYKDTFRKRGKCPCPPIYRWLSVHSLEKNKSKLSSIHCIDLTLDGLD